MTRLADGDIDWLDTLVATVAQAEIMPRFRNLQSADISEKSSATDLVTTADVEAEKRLTAALLERYPDALVAGEEACAADPSLLNGIGSADLAFVLDPVDGTFNFAHGVPLFGTMLAVTRRGETIAGIIHDPVGGDSLIAVRGGGAYVKGEGTADRPAKVAPPVATVDMVGSASWQMMPEPLRSTVAANTALFRSSLAFRCAAHEYRLAATGGIHFLLYNRLMPWDHLAGALIHREAGGHHARFDGSPYNAATLDGGIIVAPDKDAWQAIRNALIDGIV